MEVGIEAVGRVLSEREGSSEGFAGIHFWISLHIPLYRDVAPVRALAKGDVG